MFRTLIYPSSGACDCVDELPQRSFCSQFVVCRSFCCGWYLVVFVLQAAAVLQPAKRTPPNTSRNKSSDTQRTENKTTVVVIHQHSRKLLKMDILMSETCWARNKWNKIASDIKLVFHSSTIAMIHGPINIRYFCVFCHVSGKWIEIIVIALGIASKSNLSDISLKLSIEKYFVQGNKRYQIYD